MPTLGRYDDETSAKLDDNFATEIVKGLGGAENLITVGNCITRLRVTVKDSSKVDENFLKSISGVKGVFGKGAAIQVVVGLQAEALANEINGK